MQFDFRKILLSADEVKKLESSLDEYLALQGDALSRLRFKRKGPARQSMIEALAQMAMLFAAANMGEESDFTLCLQDAIEQSLQDDAARRDLRSFYLRNVSRVPGTLDPAISRLVLARPLIMDAPLSTSAESKE